MGAGVNARHPGDVLWRDLSAEQQREIERGWPNQPVVAVPWIFDGLTDAKRWHVLCSLNGRNGAHQAAEERTAENADPETTKAFDVLHEAGTAELLDQIVAVLRRFIVFSCSEHSDFIALWVLHTYVFDLFDTTPYLNVTSAAKQSGKSRLLCELLPLLVARAWTIFDASEAVLFRKVDKDHPTLLVDEVDATFGKDSKVTEGLRAIYNVGYRRGAKVARCVGNSFAPTDFDVYGPKAFAGLEGLPDTVRDRSGLVELRRRSRNEPKPERLRAKTLRLELEPLAARLAEWANDAWGQLEGAEPVLPDSLSDRAQDGYESLAAIADLAGGEWRVRSRSSTRPADSPRTAPDSNGQLRTTTRRSPRSPTRSPPSRRSWRTSSPVRRTPRRPVSTYAGRSPMPSTPGTPRSMRPTVTGSNSRSTRSGPRPTTVPWRWRGRRSREDHHPSAPGRSADAHRQARAASRRAAPDPGSGRAGRSPDHVRRGP